MAGAAEIAPIVIEVRPPRAHAPDRGGASRRTPTSCRRSPTPYGIGWTGAVDVEPRPRLIRAAPCWRKTWISASRVTRSIPAKLCASGSTTRLTAIADKYSSRARLGPGDVRQGSARSRLHLRDRRLRAAGRGSEGDRPRRRRAGGLRLEPPTRSRSSFAATPAGSRTIMPSAAELEAAEAFGYRRGGAESPGA